MLGEIPLKPTALPSGTRFKIYSLRNGQSRSLGKSTNSMILNVPNFHPFSTGVGNCPILGILGITL